MKKRPPKQTIVILWLILATSCSTHRNIIDDADPIWDQDLSDELDDLAGEDRSELFVLGAKAFAWITGTLEMCFEVDDSKLVDWFGFYYYQSVENDGDDGGSGGLRDVAGRAFLEILDSDQRQQLYDAVSDLETVWSNLFSHRETIASTLYSLKSDGDLDSGEMDPICSDAGQVEGEIAAAMAAVYQQIHGTLTDTQLQQLSDFRDGLIEIPDSDEVEQELEDLDSGLRNPVTTLAAKGFTWLTSTLDMNEEIDPGRIANYFGFNYFKDEEPAVGPYTPPKQRDEIGLAFLETLTELQRQILYDLLDEQRSRRDDYFNTRSDITAGLYALLDQGSIDENALLDSTEQSGSFDGEIAVMQAVAFGEILHSLSMAQLAHLEGIRDGSILWEP